MKISIWVMLIAVFILIPVYAHSEGYMDSKKLQGISYTQEDNSSTTSQDTTKAESKAKVNTSQEDQSQGKIKAQNICIGEDCRSKWPSLKCANYDGRPAGETGDVFCGQMDKTCVAVSIGTGQSFFGECSVPASTTHKCRCCWVE
ncbi:MAG: hypothetical protein WC723_00515 [Candidatus Omnitrophota bacterium]